MYVDEREGDENVKTDSMEETALYLGYRALMTFLAIVVAVVLWRRTEEGLAEEVQDVRIE